MQVVDDLAGPGAKVIGARVKEPTHFLLYRRGEVIEVARVLHDARDLGRHLPEG